MNKQLLRGIMAQNGDTQANLASAMGISLSRFNAKINEYHGASFTQAEISFIITRYNLTGKEAMQVFFCPKTSVKR